MAATLARLVTARRAAAGVVLLLLANAFLLWGDRARPVGVSEAVGDFRHGEHATAPPLPAAGVYVYETTGHERVNRLGIRRAYPAVTTRTVRAFSCGYEERVRIFREHTETYTVCPEGTDVRDTAFGTALSYYFVTSRASLDCGRGGTRVGAGLVPGTTATYECSGEGVSATVNVTYHGPHVVAVEGSYVPCRRVTVTTLLRGSTAGGANRALCTDERTGLVLAEKRSVGIVTRDRFVGRVTYTEEAEFRIRSLVPLS